MLSPLFLITSIILRFTGEGEIFYFQERIGRHRNTFRIFKFATMLKNSPNMGSGSLTSKADHRILPVGRFLRKSKINELPQLINILIGQMSFIGPRPHVARDLAGVSDDQLAEILSSRPGISSVASIIFRNEERILQELEEPRHFYDTVIAPYKASLELWYSRKRNFSFDMMLIFLTALSVIHHNPFIIFKILPNIPRPPIGLENKLL